MHLMARFALQKYGWSTFRLRNMLRKIPPHVARLDIFTLACQVPRPTDPTTPYLLKLL
jgi:hypothetical protein